MALIARGVTRCAHCERVITEDAEVEGFTTFVFNEADPLFRFNDAAFHRNCLLLDPLGRKAQLRADETHRRLGPGSHTCLVCRKAIKSWRENVSFPHVSDDQDLSILNYLQFHRHCLGHWPDLSRSLTLMRDGMESGRIRGQVFASLQAELETALQ